MEKYNNPRSNGSYGSMGITQNLVDAFRMRNGKDITDVTSGYREDGFVDQDIIYSGTSWNFSDHARTPGLLVPKGTFNMWADREPRFYTTVRFNLAYTVGLDGPAEYTYGKKDGRPSHDTPPCGYHGRKGTDPNATPLSGNLGTYRPGIIFRLAENYLNYAEALAEIDPTNSDIIKYLNLIRQRGGIPNLPASVNQDELRQLVRKEYRVEFAMEGKFRYDYIRRWKLAVDVLHNPITGMNPYGYENTNIGDPESFYTRVNMMTRGFDEKMYLWPISQSYIDTNSNLVQNKDWGN